MDTEVMRRVRQVALDTARGRTLELVRHLYGYGERGGTTAGLALLTNQTDDKERKLLRFLRDLGVVRLLEKENKAGVKQRARWYLTERMTRLYQEVMGDD